MKKNINNLMFAYENKKYPESFNDYLEEVDFLLNKAEECQNIIKEYDNLSDIKFYKKIKELDIDVELKKYEYPTILGIYYEKEFRGPVTINTNMRVRTGDYEGHGKDMEYHVSDSDIKLEVAYTGYMSTTHAYTKDEIDAMVALGNIVVLRKEICWFENRNTGEYCPKYGITSDDGNIYREFTDYDGKYYGATLKYMRIKFNKENLNEIYNKLINLVKGEVNIMTTMEELYNEKGFQKRISKLDNK